MLLSCVPARAGECPSPVASRPAGAGAVGPAPRGDCPAAGPACLPGKGRGREKAFRKEFRKVGIHSTCCFVLEGLNTASGAELQKALFVFHACSGLVTFASVRKGRKDRK